MNFPPLVPKVIGDFATTRELLSYILDYSFAR